MSKFLKFIVNLVVICAILVAAALLVPPLVGVKTVMIDGSGGETNLPRGSVTYGQNIGIKQLEEGDKVLVESGNAVYEYVIEGADATAGTYTMSDPYDKGAEEQSVKLSGQVAKSIVTVPYIAYAAMALQSMEGLIIVGLAIVFLVILFILSELWKKDDDEDEEEEDWEEEEETESDHGFPVPDTSHEMPGAAEALMQESLASVAQGVTEAASEKEEVSPAEKEAEISEEEPQQEEVKEETDIPAPENESQEIVTEAAEEGELVSAADMEEDIAAREQVLPSLSAQELIAKATVDGDDPEIVEDEEQGVTLLDYSKIL